jgi:hypothetical protein
MHLEIKAALRFCKSGACTSSCAAAWRPRSRLKLVPLGKLDGDAFRPVDEDKLAGVKIHDLVAGTEAIRFELFNFGLDIIDCKANVVHVDLVQVGPDADISGAVSPFAARHALKPK